MRVRVDLLEVDVDDAGPQIDGHEPVLVRQRVDEQRVAQLVECGVQTIDPQLSIGDAQPSDEQVEVQRFQRADRFTQLTIRRQKIVDTLAHVTEDAVELRGDSAQQRARDGEIRAREHVLGGDLSVFLGCRRRGGAQLQRRLVEHLVRDPVDAQLIEQVRQVDLGRAVRAGVVRIQVDGTVRAHRSGAGRRGGAAGRLGERVQRAQLAQLQQAGLIRLADERKRETVAQVERERLQDFEVQRGRFGARVAGETGVRGVEVREVQVQQVGADDLTQGFGLVVGNSVRDSDRGCEHSQCGAGCNEGSHAGGAPA